MPLIHLFNSLNRFWSSVRRVYPHKKLSIILNYNTSASWIAVELLNHLYWTHPWWVPEAQGNTFQYVGKRTQWWIKITTLLSQRRRDLCCIKIGRMRGLLIWMIEVFSTRLKKLVEGTGVLVSVMARKRTSPVLKDSYQEWETTNYPVFGTGIDFHWYF